jgi:hypothetical protein
MSLTQNRWFRRFALGAVAALSLGAAVVATVPAQADEYGYQGGVFINPASFFPRVFSGFGAGHRWDHHAYWDHQNYWNHHWR